MKLILVAFLLIFAARPCAAATVEHAVGTSGVDCSLPRGELLASEKLICADADLQKADARLTGIYTDLGERLNEGGAQAIELDHSFWFLTYEGGLDARCGIAGSRVLPADLKAYYRARNCLLTELDKRREAVAALPHEKPAAPYLLSPFERMMLRGMAGTELYLRRLLDKRINRSDNLAVGLQRSLGALLTDTETRHFAWLEGNPFDKFVETSNLGAGTLIDSRFFFYRSNIPADEFERERLRRRPFDWRDRRRDDRSAAGRAADPGDLGEELRRRPAQDRQPRSVSAARQ